jgi:hypothetical protein
VLARNYPAVGLGVAVLVVIVFVVRGLLRRKKGREGPAEAEEGGAPTAD